MATKNKSQSADQKLEDVIVVDTTELGYAVHPVGIIRICWLTGDEKHCSSCYLNKGCKARD